MKEQTTVAVASIIMLVVGFAIRYAVARRKFNRRAMTGAEGFRSYERSWSTTFGERVARWIANILIIVAILAFFSTFTNFRVIYDYAK